MTFDVRDCWGNAAWVEKLYLRSFAEQAADYAFERSCGKHGQYIPFQDGEIGEGMRLGCVIHCQMRPSVQSMRHLFAYDETSDRFFWLEHRNGLLSPIKPGFRTHEELLESKGFKDPIRWNFHWMNQIDRRHAELQNGAWSIPAEEVSEKTDQLLLRAKIGDFFVSQINKSTYELVHLQQMAGIRLVYRNIIRILQNGSLSCHEGSMSSTYRNFQQIFDRYHLRCEKPCNSEQRSSIQSGRAIRTTVPGGNADPVRSSQMQAVRMGADFDRMNRLPLQDSIRDAAEWLLEGAVSQPGQYVSFRLPETFSNAIGGGIFYKPAGKPMESRLFIYDLQKAQFAWIDRADEEKVRVTEPFVPTYRELMLSMGLSKMLNVDERTCEAIMATHRDLQNPQWFAQFEPQEEQLEAMYAEQNKGMFSVAKIDSHSYELVYFDREKYPNQISHITVQVLPNGWLNYKKDANLYLVKTFDQLLKKLSLSHGMYVNAFQQPPMLADEDARTSFHSQSSDHSVECTNEREENIYRRVKSVPCDLQTNGLELGSGWLSFASQP